MITADMRADLGQAVVEAGSAEEAMRLLEGGQQVDVLVTDHIMPGVSGTDLPAKCGSEGRRMPVLMLSGYAEAEGIAPGLARLVKPVR